MANKIKTCKEKFVEDFENYTFCSLKEAEILRKIKFAELYVKEVYEILKIEN